MFWTKVASALEGLKNEFEAQDDMKVGMPRYSVIRMISFFSYLVT